MIGGAAFPVYKILRNYEIDYLSVPNTEAALSGALTNLENQNPTFTRDFAGIVIYGQEQLKLANTSGSVASATNPICINYGEPFFLPMNWNEIKRTNWKLLIPSGGWVSFTILGQE